MSNKYRKKGNSQAASSSRAAELLASGGIGGLDILALIPSANIDAEEVSALIDEIGLNIDPELRVIFKKLSKRDAQTREKALKDLFDELKARSTDVEKIKNAFPCFASGYPKLVTDCSTVVRATADSILALFITILKKDAISQLKAVVPYLFFSSQDGHFAVFKSAEAALDDCFPVPEKRQKAIEAFGAETVALCLQIMAKQHKLVAPQKFTEEETDAQRITRLIAQAINTLEKFLECSPGLFEAIAPQFASSSTFNSLMNLDSSVKAAAFRLLKKLIKDDVGIILGTRIPSFILQNLSAEDQLLCKNTFECFIIAAADARFYEVCKIDKAVIPKMISLIRKKGLHWIVLESSLLPSISVVYDNLKETEREKWVQSVIHSFFDEVDSGIPLNSWSKAICEAYKYAFLRIEELKTEEYKAFLAEQVLRFVGVAISFGDKQPVDAVVELLMWIQLKGELVGESFITGFNGNVSKKLLTLLPKSIPIVEKYIESSADFNVAMDLLNNASCPNETFLKCFKLLDADAVDMKVFGKIVSQRIQKESRYSIVKQLMNLFVELLDDGEISGRFDDYFKEKTPLISWAIVDLCTDDTGGYFGDLNVVAEVIVRDILNGHVLAGEKHVAEFLERRISPDSKILILKKSLEEFDEKLELDNLLRIVAVFGTVDEDLGSKVFNKLLQLYLHAVDELDVAVLKKINANTTAFGKQLSEKLFKKVVDEIVDDKFDFIDITRISKFLSHLNLTFDQLMEILPQEDYLREWLQHGFLNYLVTLVYQAPANVLISIINRDKTLAVKEFNLSEGIKLAVFFGNLAYLSSDVHGTDRDGKGQFAFTSLFLFVIEKLIGLKAENGMFSPAGVEFREFQTLLNIIDRTLQDERFEYHQLLAELHKNKSAAMGVQIVNEWCYINKRRHANLTCEDIEEGSELYSIIRSLHKEKSEFFPCLNKLLVDKREEYEDWMFNFGIDDDLKEATSCVVMKTYNTLLSKKFPAEDMPMFGDFIMCGHIFAMQSIADNLNSGNKNSLYFEATGMNCLDLFCQYERTGNELEPTRAAEWRDFYRPAVVTHILSWFHVVCSNPEALSEPFVNKICTALRYLSRNDFLSAESSEQQWSNPSFIIKVAGDLLLGKKPQDAAKFAAIHLLKKFMIDMFEEGRKKEDEYGEEGPSDEQIKEGSAENKITHLPPFLDRILSSDDFTVLQKLMTWDAMIQFLNDLDVTTRVRYLLQIPARYCDEILDVFFELLPKEPEKHLKEYSFGGRLNVSELFSEYFGFNRPKRTSFEHYICNLFYRTCSTLPSVVRDWYNGLSKATSNDVNDYIKKYLSPLLIEKEMTATSNMTKGRLSIQVMPAVSEILAKYKFDEATLSLQIKLHSNYPLSKPTVEADRTIVNKSVLRKWLLQLIQFLNNENGLLLDGILQWKRNIDNHLEGVEECTICMMTVSATNYQLPKIKCKQCRKKFHGNCLYKWFDTSNNPTCPLCRSPFF